MDLVQADPYKKALTMKYTIFNKLDIAGLYKIGMDHVFVELDETGIVLREIGFDSCNRLVHKYPGVGPYGKRGVFDNAILEVQDLKEELNFEEFERCFRMSQEGPR
jgi:hypothetical protein